MRIPTVSCALCSVLVLAQTALQAEPPQIMGQGEAVVTVHAKNGKTAVAPTPEQLHLSVDGRQAQVTAIDSLNSTSSPIEMVLLIDSGLSSSLATQYEELSGFISSLPKETSIALAYMQNGQAVLATPLTSDPAVARKGLRLPLGMRGISASPYFCLTDLAEHWPSSATGVRRVVVMITDGFDPYEPFFNPDDPYLQQAISKSVRAGIQVNSIFWGSPRFRRAAFIGQNLLDIVSNATGGVSYGFGFMNAVSIAPYLSQVRTQLDSQYLIHFTATRRGKDDVLDARMKTEGFNAKLETPQKVLLRSTPLPIK